MIGNDHLEYAIACQATPPQVEDSLPYMAGLKIM